MKSDIPYGDYKAHVAGLEAYETVKDYEYTVYLGVRIDLGELPEKERHFWEEDVDIVLYLSGGEGDIEFTKASPVKKRQEGKYYYYYYKYPSGWSAVTVYNRETFLGADVTLVVRPESKKYSDTDYTTYGVIDKFNSENTVFGLTVS